MSEIKQIPVEAIEPGPFQYRRTITPEEIAGLAASIEQHQLLQPILLRPVAGKKHKGVSYQLVAGERRWRAVSSLGWEKIGAIVRSLTDLEAAEIALIENVQRENPDDWATALGIQNLMRMSAEAGKELSLRDVAAKLGKSVSFVRNHLGLFKLHPELQKLAQKHPNVKSSLLLIETVKNTDAFPNLIEMVDQGASFKTVENAVLRVKADEAWKRESQTAPDVETQSRQNEHKATGGGQVSRGRRVTGPTVAEATREAHAAIEQIERHLMSYKAWADQLGERERQKLHARVVKLLDLLDG